MEGRSLVEGAELGVGRGSVQTHSDVIVSRMFALEIDTFNRLAVQLTLFASLFH